MESSKVKEILELNDKILSLTKITDYKQKKKLLKLIKSDISKKIDEILLHR